MPVQLKASSTSQASGSLDCAILHVDEKFADINQLYLDFTRTTPQTVLQRVEKRSINFERDRPSKHFDLKYQSADTEPCLNDAL
jgi:hypothetical protein